MSAFGNYSKYYDLLYKDKDYDGEANYVHRLIQQYHPQAKSVLDLGCGTGRHALLMAQKGYKVHGVDFSHDMLKEAKRRLLESGSGFEYSPAFAQGDITSIRLGEKFDTIISLFHVISYQVTNEALHSTFETVKHHLNSNGVFIFDCWYGPCVISEKPVVRVKRLEDEKINVIRIAEPVVYPNENTVDVNYEILISDKEARTAETIKETHHLRYLFKPEIEALFDSINMQLLHQEEWMTSKVPGFDTFGVCFIGGSK